MSNVICAGCYLLDIASHPTEASNGLGLCRSMEGSNPPKPLTFVPWDTPGCVLYGKAKDDLAARRQWEQAMKNK